jgi:hypothetical protein
MRLCQENLALAQTPIVRMQRRKVFSMNWQSGRAR